MNQNGLFIFLIYIPAPWSYCEQFIGALYCKENNIGLLNISSKPNNLLCFSNDFPFSADSTKEVYNTWRKLSVAIPIHLNGSSLAVCRLFSWALNPGAFFFANHKSHEYHMTTLEPQKKKSPDMLLWVVFPKCMLAKYDCKFHCF